MTTKTAIVRAALTLSAILLALPSPGIADSGEPREVKIKGYITNVVSPEQFEIEDYRITREQTLTFEFENDSPEVRLKPEDIHVGVELDVNGVLDDTGGAPRNELRRAGQD